ncbi:hypothetical protein ROA7450_00611 [Roseovarius albus]|uniref:Uncharacterized protein n=1 Tax=Roseovarius albus TaxID=1247867 RepID=A0A1X6YFS9_9RHOB|nr:hypothetical protein [Roseovarius albus]SLN19307.1 hypothetical protein ROA7450_00611 [Roseovarius albus]
MIGRLTGAAWVHVLVGFVLMGSWAFYANAAHPMPKPLIAAVLQGSLSGTITFGLKTALDYLRERLSAGFAAWVPPLITCSVSLCVLVGVHTIAGTPEVVKTIAVPFSVASIYAVTYNLIMYKKGQSDD